MNTTLKVNLGNISLPKELQREWDNALVQIRELGADRIVIEKVTPLKKRLDLQAWKQAAGILKGHLPDPVKWQCTIRKEWDRKLPKLRVHA